MSARNFDVNKARKYGTVKIEHSEGNIIHVTLHKTVVVRFDLDSKRVTLNSGGWKTLTTKQAINTALKQVPEFKGLFLQQSKGEWFLTGAYGGEVIAYEDGMIVKATAPREFKQVA